ncbi:MAG: carbamoyl phosphate synthase large subunit, partial [Opitutae bacterium]
FKESFQKAFRSLENGAIGFSAWKHINEDNLPDKATLLANIRKPTAERVFHLRLALVAGIPIEELYATTGIDPWFLHQLLQIVELEKLLREQQVDTLDGDLLRRAKEWGFSDHQLSLLLKKSETAANIAAWILNTG